MKNNRKTAGLTVKTKTGRIFTCFAIIANDVTDLAGFRCNLFNIVKFRYANMLHVVTRLSMAHAITCTTLESVPCTLRLRLTSLPAVGYGTLLVDDLRV